MGLQSPMFTKDSRPDIEITLGKRTTKDTKYTKSKRKYEFKSISVN
jgi:hypothetical protein